MKKYYFSLFVLGIILFGFGHIQADNLKVHFIDVKQGDAMLIQYGGENYIIDSGKMVEIDLSSLMSYNGDVWINPILP